MKKIQLVFAVMVLTILSVSHSFAQRPMHEIHSMMVYNFMKYVNWPASSAQGDFVIGVIGDEDVYSTLSQWYTGKKKGKESE